MSFTPDLNDARRNTPERMLRTGDHATESKIASVGILDQMKRNKDVSRSRQEPQSTSHLRAKRKTNSFKGLRRGSDNRLCCICMLGILLILGVIVAGILVAIKVSAAGGWSLFAVGILAVLLVVACACRRKANTPMEETDIGSTQFYHKNLSEFPPDPILQRGIINLIYHGQADCEQCRFHRRIEEFRQLNISTTESYEDFPIDGSAGCSQTTSASQKLEKQFIGSSKEQTLFSKTRPSTRITVNEQWPKLTKQEVVTQHDLQQETSFITSPSDVRAHASSARRQDAELEQDKHRNMNDNNHNNTRSTSTSNDLRLTRGADSWEIYSEDTTDNGYVNSVTLPRDYSSVSTEFKNSSAGTERPNQSFFNLHHPDVKERSTIDWTSASEHENEAYMKTEREEDFSRRPVLSQDSIRTAKNRISIRNQRWQNDR